MDQSYRVAPLQQATLPIPFGDCAASTGSCNVSTTNRRFVPRPYTNSSQLPGPVAPHTSGVHTNPPETLRPSGSTAAQPACSPGAIPGAYDGAGVGDGVNDALGAGAGVDEDVGAGSAVDEALGAGSLLGVDEPDEPDAEAPTNDDPETHMATVTAKAIGVHTRFIALPPIQCL